MNPPTLTPMARRLRRPSLLPVLVTTTFAVACLAGCGRGSTTRPRVASVGSTERPALMATSLETSAGSWAVVPMGHLGEPLNTFWQLFFRPKGSTRWSDESSALAVATNGGLILSSPDGHKLVVGIRPANLLGFSPVLWTSDGGRSWSTGAPVSALAAESGAMATGAGGAALAIVEDGHAQSVSTSPRGLSGWRGLVTAGALSSSPAGRACEVASLSAVALGARQHLLGANCRRGGVVGLFAEDSKGWHLVGPRLPTSLAHASVAVLGIEKTARGLVALLLAGGLGRLRVVAASTRSPGSRTWHLSQVFRLNQTEHVESFGPGGPGGLFVLTSDSAGRGSLEVLGRSQSSWQRLPAPPTRTATVVFGHAGGTDALAVADTSFTDWRLDPAADRWTKSEVIHVALQFGSSG